MLRGFLQPAVRGVVILRIRLRSYPCELRSLAESPHGADGSLLAAVAPPGPVTPAAGRVASVFGGRAAGGGVLPALDDEQVPALDLRHHAREDGVC